MRLALIAMVAVHDRRIPRSRCAAPGCRPWLCVVDDSASMGIEDRYDDKKLAALVAKRLRIERRSGAIG